VLTYSTNGVDYLPLLTVDSAVEQVWSVPLPGETAGAVTVRVRDSNRTAGKRSLDSLYVDRMYIRSETPPPPPTVTLSAMDDTAAEMPEGEPPDSGTVVVARSGVPQGDLTVYYTPSGTAANGTDYSTLTGSVVIPDGATSATIVISPVDDGTFESDETVQLTLSSSPGYVVGAPSAAAVTIQDNDTVLTGTSGADVYYLRRDAAGTSVEIFQTVPPTGPPAYVRTLESLPSLTFATAGGDDSLTVDGVNGEPSPAGGLFFHGGTGQDVLHVDGATFRFTGDAGEDTASLTVELVNGAVAEVEATQHWAGLSIGSTCRAEWTEGGKGLVVGSLTIAGEVEAWTGTLDLADGYLVIHDPADPNVTLAEVTSMIASGFHGGDWLGAGITSSVAGNDPDGVLAIGVVNNAEIGYETFPLEGGEAVGATDILVLQTYYGDADLDGDVDGDDYQQWLAGYNDAQVHGEGATLRGWLYGDFDYGADVTADDYQQWLYNYNYFQGLGGVGGVVGSSEPSAAQGQAVTGEQAVAERSVPPRRQRGKAQGEAEADVLAGAKALGRLTASSGA